jgi:hypothetical protein
MFPQWTLELNATLLNCKTDADLLSAFPDYKIESLKRRQRKLRQGDTLEPQEGGEPMTKPKTTLNSTARDRIGKLADLLDKNGIPIEEIGRVEKVRIGTYQMLTKDNEGEAQIHDLEVASLVLAPKWADGPKWPVIQQAARVKFTPVKPPAKLASAYGKTCVVLPDPQIGYRLDPKTGSLDPFHDERAMSVALQAIAMLQPDLIINLGDFLDFANFGKYVQEPAFAHTVQPALDRAHKFLMEQKAAAPSAHIVLFEGNHDRRLQNSTIQNAASAFGLQRANVPEEWPVLSVPFLLRLEEIDVEYIDAYPAGRYWINDRLNATHGHIVRSGGSTARAVSDDERVSQVFGHIHRIEMHYKTVNVRDGGRTNFAFSPGCLCRIDGAVPSVKGSTDAFGRPIVSYENWQQGFAVITYQDGDAPFALEHAYIHEGFCLFRGQPITAE